MEIALIVVLGLVIPLAFFAAAVGVLIGVEWCLHRANHFTIRDLLIATTLLAFILVAASYIVPRL